MKISREKTERMALRHMLSNAKAVAKAIGMQITKDHFSFVESGQVVEEGRHPISYTKNLFHQIITYFEQSDGSLLTRQTLEHRLVQKKVSDLHKGKLLSLWEDIMMEDYDENDLFDLLSQLKEQRAMTIYTEAMVNSNSVLAGESTDEEEGGLKAAVDYVQGKLDAVKRELNLDVVTSEEIDFTKSADWFRNEWKKRKSRPPGILCGMDEIDRRTKGWQGGMTVVVLGPSGGGKSVVMLNWAEYARKQNKKVLYFSFELPLWMCHMRHVSLAYEVPFSAIKGLDLDDERVEELASNLTGGDDEGYFIYNFTTADPTPEYIDMRIRELEAEGIKPDIVFVDYIGQMQIRDCPRGMKSWEIHEKAFDGLLKIALHHDLPIITAQQINRDTLKDSRKQRDAGKMFSYDQTAASGGQHIMHQSHYGFVIEPDKENEMAAIFMAKGRDTWVPPFGVRVKADFNKFEDLSPDDQQEWRDMKGLGGQRMDGPPKDADKQPAPRVKQTDDGKTTVTVNGVDHNYEEEDLSLDGLDIDLGDWGD